MRTTHLAAGLALAFALACAGTTEPAPAPDPVVAKPEPEPDRGKAGKRRKAPGRGGKARGTAPPDPYVAEGACPGECCTYRRVVARVEATLHAAPKGREVGTIAAGEEVDALTGEVHLHPTAATVKRAHTLESEDGDEEVKPGDRIWLLDTMGEGWGHVWHDGGVFAAEVLFALVDDCDDGEPAEMCWAKVEGEPTDQTWWVKVERADGTTGWVDNTDDALKGFDACG